MVLHQLRPLGYNPDRKGAFDAARLRESAATGSGCSLLATPSGWRDEGLSSAAFSYGDVAVDAQIDAQCTALVLRKLRTVPYGGIRDAHPCQTGRIFERQFRSLAQ